MVIKAKFDNVLDDWLAFWTEQKTQHEGKQDSRDINYRNCDAYLKLIRIGKSALPFIKEVYQDDKFAEIGNFFGLWSVTKDILKEEFPTPEHILGNGLAARDYTRSFLEVYLLKSTHKTRQT